MKMKSSIISFCLISLFAMSACEKASTCTGRAADGETLFTVEGSDLCDSQINKANGEFCDCED